MKYRVIIENIVEAATVEDCLQRAKSLADMYPSFSVQVTSRQLLSIALVPTVEQQPEKS